MGTCSESVLHMQNLLAWSDLPLYTMEERDLESLDVPGRKQLWTLTQKIRYQSSGMATRVKRTLYSMNFAELLTSVTYSDGWTDIQYSLKLKDLAQCYEQVSSGSLQTFTQYDGTQI